MDIKAATISLSALAQETRLTVFRLLVRYSPDGLPAGEIARQLAIPHNTLSAHLNVMSHAGLVQSTRAGRSIIYSIDFAAVRDLLLFLMQDCCQGRAELCEPLIDTVLSECCSS